MDSSLPSSEKNSGKTNEIHNRELFAGNALGEAELLPPLLWHKGQFCPLTGEAKCPVGSCPSSPLSKPFQELPVDI